MAVGGFRALVSDIGDVAHRANRDALVLIHLGNVVLAPILALSAPNVLWIAQVDQGIEGDVVIGAILAIVNAVLEGIEDRIAAVTASRASLKRHGMRLRVRIVARKRARRGCRAVD